MLADLVSRRVQLLNREPHLPDKYIRYITKLSDQAPHFELFLVPHGIGRDVRDVRDCDFQRVNGKWVM
jgi:hypothetical protein